MMIIVTSLAQSVRAYDDHCPSHVISILEGDEAAPPAFENLSPENHLRLIENCAEHANCNDPEGMTRCQRLINFAQSWDRKAPLLVHCHQGIARSMAAAFIVNCTVETERNEADIARCLRLAAPHADPNLLLISEADELLDRDDRMVEAILDLCPSCSTVSAPIVTLPVAA